MKAILTIEGKSVEIELTADQVGKVKKITTSYTDIKTLQDALDYIGESLESFNSRTQFDDDAQKAYKELEVIVLAIRQGNDLGHNKGDRWYYPWFNSARSSAGFSYGGSHCVVSFSYVGSRLCVESSEKAVYLGKQFLETYNRYINGSNLQIKVVESQAAVSVPKEFKSYTDIKTFNDACLAVGITESDFHEKNKNLDADTYAYEQLKVISKALNGGDHMDYTDEDVYKYYPWFNAVGSSAGFSCRAYNCAYSYSRVGSRLTYKSREIAEYAGNQFLDIYNKYIN